MRVTGFDYFSPGTANWTFVGGNITDQVINQGINNIFSGFSVNFSEAPFEQTIVDNPELTKEWIHDLKNNR